MSSFLGAVVGTFLGWVGSAVVTQWFSNRLRERESRNAALVAAAILSLRSDTQPRPNPTDTEVN